MLHQGPDLVLKLQLTARAGSIFGSQNNSYDSYRLLGHKADFPLCCFFQNPRLLVGS
jgi:hypothetical protein